MFWRLTNILQNSSNPQRRRSRRCVPSLSGSAACLEDRTILSTMGGGEHVAHVAHHAARQQTTAHADQMVTSLYESILHTTPTDAQLAQGIHQVRRGKVKVLRRHLVKMARREARAKVGGDPPALLLSSTGNGIPNTALLNLTAPNTAIPNLTAPNTALVNLTAPNTATLGMGTPILTAATFLPAVSSAQSGVSGLVPGFTGTPITFGTVGGGSSLRFLVTGSINPALTIGTTTVVPTVVAIPTTNMGTTTIPTATLPTGLTSGTTLASGTTIVPVSVTSSGTITSAGSITPTGQLPLSQLPVTPVAVATSPVNASIAQTSPLMTPVNSNFGVNLIPVVI